MTQKNTVKIKSNKKYRGHGYYIVPGEIVNVDKEIAKQLLKDFPKDFTKVISKKKTPKKKKK